MDKKRICIVCVIMVFSIMTGYLFEKKSKEEISMEPDVVSSISMNRDQYLTVVANPLRYFCICFPVTGCFPKFALK